MAVLLSPAKVILLAVHYVVHAEMDNVRHLATHHRNILQENLLLRILLTHLPETLSPSVYADFVHEVALGDIRKDDDYILDYSPLDELTDEQAIKKLRRLHLLDLSSPEKLTGNEEDSFSHFLFQRAYKVDEEVGRLGQIIELASKFPGHQQGIRTWTASTVLPLSRRNSEYYTQTSGSYSLRQFEALPDFLAVEYLISRSGQSEDKLQFIGRDFRGLISPWFYNDARWTFTSDHIVDGSTTSCKAWWWILEWLLTKASKSWKIAICIFEQWDGPSDVDFGKANILHLRDSQLQYLHNSYARAALASAYLVPETTIEALDGTYRMVNKIRSMCGYEADISWERSLDNLPIIPYFGVGNLMETKDLIAYMRTDLLSSKNPLTKPTERPMQLLSALVLSSLILARFGVRCSVRRAGELVFVRDAREQRVELVKLIHLASSQEQKNNDIYWERTRREILWLHDWGQIDHDASKAYAAGVFGMVPRQDIETEILKAMLLNMRYSLAKYIYEEAEDRPLPDRLLQDSVHRAALEAFDNAANPNRLKGGLKKCNDIVHTMSKAAPQSSRSQRQIESLLSAAHALSSYRLVLKKGEPFRPVVLRVHSDPISILEKVLDQNPGAYTRLQEFLEIGIHMVTSNSVTLDKSKSTPCAADDESAGIIMTQKRIVSMCISAALHEDDFETAYSYVVSRLVEQGSTPREDAFSWAAALKAGQYTRTTKSLQPTHLGTSSGNPEIRNLEQRLECLACSLRIAPAYQLQNILESFRQCEEQLNAAIIEEAEKEAAWDTVGDLRDLPGSFDMPIPGNSAYPPQNITASASAKQTEEAPMSLFDLSRATARVATKNLTTLSSLSKLAQGAVGGSYSEQNADEQVEPRARKRDQLREDATRTLVSGVGWLLGANVPRDN